MREVGPFGLIHYGDAKALSWSGALKEKGVDLLPVDGSAMRLPLHYLRSLVRRGIPACLFFSLCGGVRIARSERWVPSRRGGNDCAVSHLWHASVLDLP